MLIGATAYGQPISGNDTCICYTLQQDSQALKCGERLSLLRQAYAKLEAQRDSLRSDYDAERQKTEVLAYSLKVSDTALMECQRLPEIYKQEIDNRKRERWVFGAFGVLIGLFVGLFTAS